MQQLQMINIATDELTCLGLTTDDVDGVMAEVDALSQYDGFDEVKTDAKACLAIDCASEGGQEFLGETLCVSQVGANTLPSGWIHFCCHCTFF